MDAKLALLKGALHRVVDAAIALDEAQESEFADAEQVFRRNVRIVLTLLDARAEA